MILSVDTSNYTTSACLFDRKQGIVWQNRIILHPPEKQCGLRQSDVVFLHTKNLEILFRDFPKLSEPIQAVVASSSPRRIEGSYMPCFLVGQNFATSVSKILGCKFETFSHQENHIAAALYSANKLDLLQDEFIAFHISGGTSDVLKVTYQDEKLNIEQIGTSNDLHAGQLIDRIGVMLGMQFPCGKEIEKLAQISDKTIPIKICVNEFSFNLSGFENRAQKLYSDGTDVATVAKFALDCILKTLDKVIANLKEKYGNIPILFSGGVMSNKYISASLKKKYENIYFSDPFYSSDHALGNAVLYSLKTK